MIAHRERTTRHSQSIIHGVTLLFLVYIALASGCSSTPTVLEESFYGDQKYSPRAAPARIIEDDEQEAYELKGYGPIGHMEICGTLSTVRRIAASRGADLVTIWGSRSEQVQVGSAMSFSSGPSYTLYSGGRRTVSQHTHTYTPQYRQVTIYTVFLYRRGDNPLCRVIQMKFQDLSELQRAEFMEVVEPLIEEGKDIDDYRPLECVSSEIQRLTRLYAEVKAEQEKKYGKLPEPDSTGNFEQKEKELENMGVSRPDIIELLRFYYRYEANLKCLRTIQNWIVAAGATE